MQKCLEHHSKRHSKRPLKQPLSALSLTVPELVHTVPMEASPYMIVDAPPGHGRQGVQDHLAHRLCGGLAPLVGLF